MTNWIPVTERLPEHGEDVLVTLKQYTHVIPVTYIASPEKWEGTFYDYASDDVLAWMDLPPVYRPIEEDVW